MTGKNKKFVLTIAGSDSGAGAGIQSDIKTFKNHGVYGLSVVTAVTAQNTKGVQSSLSMPAKMIDAQLKSVFDDFDITLRNNDNRTIIASGRAKIGDYIRNNYDSNYRMVSFITYKIKIDCKDYKYRYSISDIKITTFSNLFETPQFDWISFWCAWSDYGLINTPYFTYGDAKIKTEIYSYTISEIYV